MAVRNVRSVAESKRRKRLDQAIQDFHDWIDTVEIEGQLDGKTAVDRRASLPSQHEFRARTVVSRMLSQPLNELSAANATKLRVKFISCLSSLCQVQESRRHRLAADDVPVRPDGDDLGRFSRYDHRPKRTLDGSSNAPSKRVKLKDELSPACLDPSNNGLQINIEGGDDQPTEPDCGESIMIANPYPITFDRL
ncbi:MAG: hypothetical protein Q9198_010381, partial [Flavoplaca austrocitrina]